MELNARKSGSPLYITTNGLKIRHAELKELLQQKLKEYRGSGNWFLRVFDVNLATRSACGGLTKDHGRHKEKKQPSYKNRNSHNSREIRTQRLRVRGGGLRKHLIRHQFCLSSSAVHNLHFANCLLPIAYWIVAGYWLLVATLPSVAFCQLPIAYWIVAGYWLLVATLALVAYCVLIAITVSDPAFLHHVPSAQLCA